MGPALEPGGAALIGRHRRQRRGEIEAEEAVEPRHRGLPVAVHLLIMDVDLAVGRDLGAGGDHPFDLEVGLAQPFLAHPAGIGMVGIDDRLVPRQRGGAADHRERIAMGEDQPRIGEHAQQRRQVEHVLRRLEHPRAQRAGLLRPADQAQQPRHLEIGRGSILRFAPAAIVGHPPLRFVLHAPEAADQQAELLLRLLRPGRVDGQRARIGEPRHLEDAAGQRDAKIALAMAEAGARHRADRLEAAQMVEAVIGRQQAVEPGGARAHRPDDHHRARQRAGENLRVGGEPLLRPQPVHQHLVELLQRRPFARRIEPRLIAHRIQQHVERPFEPRITEIVEPGASAGAFHQRGFFEDRRDREPAVAGDPHPGIHNVDKAGAPRRAGWVVSQSSSPLPLCPGRQTAAMPILFHRAKALVGAAGPLAAGHCRWWPA